MLLTAPSLPIFSFPYRIYINHTDAGGIVYHANHLSFYEHCRRDWLASLGLAAYFFNPISDADTSNNEHEHRPHHFVVTEAQLKYLQAIVLDETIIVTIDNIQVRSASLIFEQSIYRSVKPDSCQIASISAAPSSSSITPTAKALDASESPIEDLQYQKSLLLSQAKITIACVCNERIPSNNTPSSGRTATNIRPARLPTQLRDAIAQVLDYD